MKIFHRNPSLRIPLLYALFGLAWILLTDQLLIWLSLDLEDLVLWQTIKGWLFVVLSTLLIFLLLLQAQRRQQQSENLYRLLFDNNPLPMWVYDLETLAFLEANNAAVQKYGYSRAEFRQMTLHGIRPEEDVARLLEDVAQTSDRLNFAGEWRHRRKDGTIFPVEIISHALTFAGRPSRLVVANDITERKQAENALRESEARYRKLFRQLRQVMDSVPEGVLLLKPAGQIVVANPRALAHLDLLAGAGIGDTVTRLGNQPLETLLAAPPPGTWHEVQAAGRIFDLLAHPLETGPVPQGWVLVIRDVTEERTVLQQMQRQQRLAAIGQLAAGIAHDFNNIIHVILLYVELLMEEPGTTEEGRQRLAIISQQAHQAVSLVEQILDFSRKALLEPQSLDFVRLLKDQVTLLQRVLPPTIEMSFTSQVERCVTQADVTRIQQMLMNLALNARDAMPEGGKLAFELAPVPVTSPDKAPVPGMKTGDWLRLDVSDTGRGIRPELLDRIFEPFFTTKSPGQGTGLGLAQAHGIIGQHGGHIVVSSEVGNGTTFTIYLPVRSTRA